MKEFKVKYSGKGQYSFIKATTTVKAKDESGARKYITKYYPAAIVLEVKEVI